MFYLGYLFGSICSGLLLTVGYFLGYRSLNNPESVVSVPPLFKRRQKKKPVFISEEEQWKREQKLPPLDPGL